MSTDSRASSALLPKTSIRTKLFVSAAISVGLAVVVALTVFLQYRNVGQAARTARFTREVIKEVSELNSLGYAYLLLKDERPRVQWQLRRGALEKVLLEHMAKTPYEKTLITKLRSNLELMKGLFEDAVKGVEESRVSAKNGTSSYDELIEGITAQLMARSEIMVNDASLLGRESTRRVDSIQRQSFILVLAAAFLLILSAFMTAFLLLRSIGGSVRVLKQGTRRIAAGDFEYRLEMPVNDELGDLGRAFNDMSEQLKRVTVSKDRLELEVEERRRVEEALRESEQRWSTTLRSIGDAVIATDTGGRITFMNDVAEASTGWTLGDALQEPIGEVFHIVHEHTRAEVESPVTKVLREGMIVGLANHTILMRKDGMEIPIDDSGAPITDKDGKTTGVVLVFRDITDRKQAEEELRKSGERYRLLAETMVQGVVHQNENGEIVAMNPAAELILGKDREQFVGSTSVKEEHHTIRENGEIFPGMEHPSMVALRTGQQVRGVIMGVFNPKVGDYRWISVDAMPIFAPSQVHPSQVYTVFQDITERKRAEEEVRLAAETFKRTFHGNAAAMALSRIDDGRVLDLNERWVELTGFRREEAVGRTSSELGLWKDPGDRAAMIREVEQSGAVQGREVACIHRNGQEWTGLFSAQITTVRGNRVLISSAIDITERKRAEEALRRAHDLLELRVEERTEELREAYESLKEETREREKAEFQLRQSQKMEAIGTLAGGIAHDFNNILASVLGFTEMAIDDVPDRPLVEKNLRNVLKSAMRARELVKQILAFSRKTNYERGPLALTPILRETVQLLRASIPTTIDIRLSVIATSDMIRANPVEVQQILMNLATNASLAMQEKGGTVEISLSDIDFESEAPVPDADVEPGEYAQLMVKDTGIGMAHDVMKRVFEPFFTTREVGKGTGMGLAVVYGIVKDLQGMVTVESEQGVGSTFRVLLPKVKTRAEDKDIHTAQIRGGKERILFVDDEDMLTEWGQALLGRLGYTVTAFTDSMGALNAVSSDPSRFDLVITDQTMSGLTGIQLTKEILKINPDIPIILCTGHSETISPDIAKESGIREYLMKPLARQELAEAVRRVLDEKAEERRSGH